MRLSRQGLVTAVLVVAAPFIGSTITERLPDPDEVRSRPFPHAVAVGEPAQLRTGEVTVTEVAAAAQIEQHAQVAGTSGVWLVVGLVWSPTNQPGAIVGSVVVIRAADDRSFGGTQAISTVCGSTQPGLPVTCRLAFEVPVDALEGAQLLIPAGDSIAINDDVAVVDLGIDARAAALLGSSEARIVLQEPPAVEAR